MFRSVLQRVSCVSARRFASAPAEKDVVKELYLSKFQSFRQRLASEGSKEHAVPPEVAAEMKTEIETLKRRFELEGFKDIPISTKLSIGELAK